MKFKFLICIVIVGLSMSSCKTWKNSEKGAVIGGAVGAGAGAAIGHQSGNTAVGAIIGAAVGGATGALIGNYMDKQAAEMERDLQGAKIERVGEGIKITFDSGLLFDIDKDQLKSNSEANIANLSRILKKYDDTNILVEGHTDNTGSDEYNQRLSERRATSVSSQLRATGVAAGRISTKGYGETQAIGDNTTDVGRQQNRRVEVAVFANKKLKRAAENGELGGK